MGGGGPTQITGAEFTDGPWVGRSALTAWAFHAHMERQEDPEQNRGAKYRSSSLHLA